MTATNYQQVLKRQAADHTEDDLPRALSCTALRQRQSLDNWRHRWAEYHKNLNLKSEPAT